MTTSRAAPQPSPPPPPPSGTGHPGSTAWTRALGLALLLFVAGRCLVPMDETDVFYNLRLGEIILDTHHVPRTNLLSFTYPDHPDPNLAWLFQIVLALIHRAWGIPGTVILKTAFVVTTFGLLYRIALRRGSHPAIAALALALAAWAAEPRFVERPHLVTFLGLATLLLALERAEADKPCLLWSMIPLGLVWANGNSCFFLAPAVLVLYAAGACADGARPDARRAVTVGAALVPLVFATPSGVGALGYIANHFRMPWLRPLQEYRTAEWPVDGPFFFLVALVVALTASSVLGWPARVPRARWASGGGIWRQLLPLAALGALGSRRIRFVAEFALLAGPAVAARATEIAGRLLAGRQRARSVADADADTATATPSPTPTLGAGFRAHHPLCAATLVALAALTLVPRVRAARAGAPAVDVGEERGLVPWTAIAWLDAHGLRDHLYNDLEVGSALAWSGWPAHRVFQDPRINAYPAELHAVLRRIDLDRPAWEAFLDRFAVTAALISFPDLNPRATRFDPERWALVYRDDDALVFVRRSSEHAALIATDELPVGFRLDPSGGVNALPLEARPAAATTPACEWAQRLARFHASRGENQRAAFWYRRALAGDARCLSPAARDDARYQAGTLALRAGEAAYAIELLAGLRLPEARTNLGFALLQLGRPGDALAELEGVARGDPGSAEAAFGRALALARLDRADDAATALRAFLARWPGHFAAPEAEATLRRLPR
jgi:tetratricopeptide (TPR) repeat protein